MRWTTPGGISPPFLRACINSGKTGSASLAVVAPGISEALVATAAGLAVAIPAVIFYNYYSNAIAEMESEMQSFAADFMNLIERDLISKVESGNHNGI